MRVRIIFNLKNRGSYVPFHHQYLLAQLIKGVLLQENNQEFNSFSQYIFSALKGQTKVSRNGLHYYSSKVTLVLSSPNQKFIDFFLQCLFRYKQVEVGGLLLQPDSVEKEVEPELTTVSKFICISPIVLLTPSFNDGNAKRFISPETDNFSDLLYESTMLRMSEYGFTAEQLESFYKFQVVPDKTYLGKIRSNQKKFARIYPVYNQDVKYEVRGYTFPFTLYAAREVQEFVFNCGLSSFTHKGFGMLDLANSDPAKRAVEYKFE